MENEEKKENAGEDRELSAGEKFVKELYEMPYTNDMVGKVFVITRIRGVLTKKSNETDHQDH